MTSQIEYRATIDKAAGENSDLPLPFIKDTSGTTAFSFETLCFEPIFQPGEKLRLPENADESVDFTQPDHFEGKGIHVLRRPLVNPGWSVDQTKPKVRLHPRVAPCVREALSSFLVGFREESRHAEPDGRLRRTLVLVNDYELSMVGTVRLFFGDHDEPFWQTEFSLEPGELKPHSFDEPLPNQAQSNEPHKIRAEWESGKVRGTRIIARITPPPQPEPEESLTSTPIAASGISPTILDWLCARCADLKVIESSAVPPPNSLWIIGADAHPPAEAVDPFLEQGGRALVLRREGACTFLPPVVEHVSGLRANQPVERPWGLSPVGRERSAIIEVPVIAYGHPILDGLVPQSTPASPRGALLHWNAGDGRLADDIYQLPDATDNPASGHLHTILGGPATDQSVLLEWQSEHSRLLFCQLLLEENLEKTPEAAQILANCIRHLCATPSPAPPVAWHSEKGPVAPPEWMPSTVVDGDSHAFRIIQTTDLDAIRCSAHDAMSDLGAFLQEGGRALVLPPVSGHFADSSTLSIAGDDPLIVNAAADDDPLLRGLTVSFLETFVSRQSLLPLCGDDDQQQALLRIHRAPRDSAIAGLGVSEPLAALWTRHRIGRGELHICSADFAGETRRCRHFLTAVLANAGVFLKMPAIQVPEVHEFQIEYARRPLPLDGDLDKWAPTQTDANVAPWSRSQRAILSPCKDPAFPKIRHAFQDHRCGALAYALWDHHSLYAAILAVAPVFNPPPRKSHIWDYSACEVGIGYTRILFSVDAQDRPRFNVTGASLGDPAEELRVAVRQFEHPPEHPELAALGLGDDDHLRAQFHEIAVPWSFLERDPPQPDEKIELSFKALICDQPDSPKIGDLVAPETLLTHGGKLFEATFRE